MNNPTGSAEVSVSEKRVTGTLLKDTLRVMTGRGAHVGFNIAAGIVTSRIWGAEAVGLIALAMWAPSLITRFLFLGMSKSIPFAIGRKLASMEDIIGTLVSLWAILSVIGTLVGIGYVYSPACGQNIPMLWVVLGLATMPISIISTYARGVAMGVERMDFMLRFHWLRDPVLLITCVIGGWVLGYSDPSYGWIRLLGHILTYVAGVVLGVHLIRQYTSLRPRWNKEIVKFMWSMSIKFGLGVSMMIINYRISIFLLNLPLFSISEAEIGNYSRAESIAMLLWGTDNLKSNCEAVAQTLLRATLPGICDTYQGDETWFLSLTDPDVRRPIDGEGRLIVRSDDGSTRAISAGEVHFGAAATVHA